jgi:Protein of unknown function (DUF1580)
MDPSASWNKIMAGLATEIVRKARARRPVREKTEVINVESDNLVPVSQLTGHLEQRLGRRLHVSTPFRWAGRGVVGPGGERVVLETLRIGGSQYTSLGALQTFCDQLTARRNAGVLSRPPASRRRAAERAAAECDALGL